MKADRIGGEVLEGRGGRVLALQPGDEAGEAGVLEGAVVEGLGEVRALGRGVGDPAVLIDEDQVGIARLGDEAAGHLLHLAVAAAVHACSRRVVEGDPRLRARGRAERLHEAGEVGLGGVEGLEEVGEVRDDLRVVGGGEEIRLHPVGHQFDPVPPGRRREVEPGARRLDQAGPRRRPAESPHRRRAEQREADRGGRQADAEAGEIDHGGFRFEFKGAFRPDTTASSDNP